MEYVLAFILFAPEVLSLLIFATVMTYEKIFPNEEEYIKR